MREGLVILQLLVIEKTPGVLEGAWSPLLLKIASSPQISLVIADFLLSTFNKRDLIEELRGILANNLVHLTPSTVFFLRQPSFKVAKSQ